MFDTHAHLTDSRFNADRDLVIENAVQEGVSGIVCVCSDFEELDVFYRLLKEYNFIYGAVGIHPHDAAMRKKLQAKLRHRINVNVNMDHPKIFYLFDVFRSL